MGDDERDRVDDEEGLGPQRDADETTQADAGLTGGEPREDDEERVGDDES